jgi:bifunctional NMN adenylyltransferase/nudix hydrolase
MTKPYDATVFIGRFQPPHKAHFDVIDRAAQSSNRVIIIIGSAYAPRSPKNPWTAEERHKMLVPALKRIADQTGAEFDIEYNIDTLYDDDGWIARVQDIVKKYTKPTDKIGIIGHKKDVDTTRYLNMFPQWDYIPTPEIEVLNATDLRNMYFSDQFNPRWFKCITEPYVQDFLSEFILTPEYENIREEKKIVDAYREKAKAYPFPIVAVTCDAVVVQSGHVLLVKRRAHPGRGLWALPGGYFDANGDSEPIDGIIRELKEETAIDVPEKILRGSVREIRTFSAPNRSQLGRSITFAAHIGLSGGEWKLPKVKGSDDAEKAKWVPFTDVRRDMLFDDHFDIISHFIPFAK